MDLRLLGQRIRQARERLGISQEQLALAVSKDQGAISEYENGRRKIPAVELPSFAEVLQVPILYFYQEAITPDDFDQALLSEFHRLPNTSKPGAIEILRVLGDMTSSGTL